jgi:hypothetical protein
LEQSEQVLDQPIIQVLPTQMGVARCRQDLRRGGEGARA